MSAGTGCGRASKPPRVPSRWTIDDYQMALEVAVLGTDGDGGMATPLHEALKRVAGGKAGPRDWRTIKAGHEELHR